MSVNNTAFSVSLFYSYCHVDTEHRAAMEKSLAFLKNDDLLSDWYDQKITPGKKITTAVRKKMHEADILVFLLSQSFIASNACMDEWQWAKDNISTNRITFRVPIILEDCAWIDLLGCDDLKALPYDGQSVCSFEHPATAWHQVYEGIKLVVEELRNNFSPRDEFLDEIEQTDFLSQNQIKLSDIYIFSRLSGFSHKTGGVQLSDETIAKENHLLEKRCVLVHGVEMSGKTALCRHLFLHLSEQSLPVLYIDLEKISGKPSEEHFKQAYQAQFHGDYTLWRLIKNKTLLLDNLSEAPHLIDFIEFSRGHFKTIIVTLSSDIFASFYRDDTRLADFYEMKIEQLSHVQQEELIRRRLALTSPDQEITDGFVDQVEDRVNSIVISNKIVPRYPFYVLSILQTYEAFMPANLSITSFGHCYHALIVAKLIKTGISQRDSDINSCFNFAENFAYYIYQSDLQGNIIGMVEFAEFVKNYRNAYIIADSTLNRLRNDQHGILTRDGQFRATFMYYFFLGRYLARNQIGHPDDIAQLCEECHIPTLPR